MAEAIGTAIGVVGFLGQLFDGCVKAYGYFSAAANLDADSQRLLCKVRIEEMRLVVWGRGWGVAEGEGRLEAHLNGFSREAGDPRMAGLAEGIMRELHATVTDFGRLRERYGFVEDGGGEGGKLGNGDGGVGGGEKGGEGKKRDWRREISRRAKWVIADKEKFTTLLTDLKYFNDGLEQLFPPRLLPSLHRSWRHSLLDSARRDVAQLALLESSSADSYPQLTASANLKKLRINLDAEPQASFRPTFAFRIPRTDLDLAPSSSSPTTATPLLSPPLPTSPTPGTKRRNSSTAKAGSSPSSSSLNLFSLTSPTTNTTRTHATHTTHGPVLVEWVEYDPSSPDERFLHLRRLDDLARMMHSASSNHPDLHTIDCIGYTDDSNNARYGLVYRCRLFSHSSLPTSSPPATNIKIKTKSTTVTTTAAAPPPSQPQPQLATSHSTLHTLISSPDLKTPDLDDRITLASTLACALWSLHSLDWLHKSLCSANILFFPSAASLAATRATTVSAAVVPDIGSPYLVGFDASRPDFDAEMSVNPRNPSILDLHRDPRSLGSGLCRKQYCKGYDVYSLGLVLLEIGLWKVLQTYYKPHYSAEKWRDRIILPVLVPGLGSKTGKLYKQVVEKCLTAKDNMSSSEAGQLMEWVVTTLESIRT
ncbi:prion-inhibition and propagation-domain-containing protein [Colletotrichum phormii]|uniref:Prion-inhibition and propagation-domain-containing protein n=1 Tax=Colletotrichum phormii TaxID=359342 RepID=A0AAI9ZYM2_9PEZI|nr:prion-inhibition and propagation-domain-containing protein [Colletotrichum phormii]KAK1639254.1 prion-inhibition and propagation-domain-containing protein [Colletotrichum phormii]